MSEIFSVFARQVLISKLEGYVTITEVSFCIFVSDERIGVLFVVGRIFVWPLKIELEVRNLIGHTITIILG